jgi:UMF1 family MFS transporter
LARAGAGDLWLAVAAVVLSNLCYSIGESLTAAFLPELARPEALGKVSGWGWSLGLLWRHADPGAEPGLCAVGAREGLPATHFVPVSMLITAVVYALASLATFALLRERAVPAVSTNGAPLPGRLGAPAPHLARGAPL